MIQEEPEKPVHAKKPKISEEVQELIENKDTEKLKEVKEEMEKEYIRKAIKNKFKKKKKFGIRKNNAKETGFLRKNEELDQF